MRFFFVFFFVSFLTLVVGSLLVMACSKTFSQARAIRAVIWSAVSTLVLVGLMIAWFWPVAHEIKILSNFEKNVRSIVTGEELQSWAANLLTRPDDAKLMTNYPQSLHRLLSVPPQVEIHTNSQTPYVVIYWGGKGLTAGFEIGYTNFISRRGSRWQDGVYSFVTRGPS